MGDHFSGPRVFSDPAADITDLFAFPSPERPGHVVLVLDTFPGAAPTVLFSDAITYRFRVRPVTLARTEAAPAYAVGEDEYVFDFAFTAPSGAAATADEAVLVQTGTCTAPNGDELSFRVGDETPAESHGLRIFAGARLDPFFIDLTGVRETTATKRLAFRPGASNSLDGQNALSIVLEFDAAAVLPEGVGPLLAVVGETVTSGGHPVRLEHAGRPEFKNFVLADKHLDPVNRDIEIRDLFNSEDAFKLEPYYLDAYRSRLDANLAFFDGLDDKTDWPLNARGEHPLTGFLLADFLVLDISQPFSENTYLEIDRALLAGRAHTTCGGRPLNDDIVDKFFTLMVGGVDGAPISDGVDQATQPSGRSFPYLVAANPTPPHLTPPFALPPASASASVSTSMSAPTEHETW
jgi:hypothetical protein